MTKIATLMVSEMFVSIQGESSWVGCVCGFIRLTGCPLRCSYCDTKQAYSGGKEMLIDELVSWAIDSRVSVIEITGGEPLAQEHCATLVSALHEEGFSVLVETSGALNIDTISSEEAIRIVDIKTPSSGMVDKMDWDNIKRLTSLDEVKFVISDRVDYDFAVECLEKYRKFLECEVIFSPVSGAIEPKCLAEWIIADRLFVKMQVQLHKILWGENSKGV